MKDKQMRNKTNSALKLFSLALTAASWLAAMLALTAGQTEAATLKWDASGTGHLTDGSGAWDGGTYWWSGGPSDVLWIPGSDAVFGNGGTAGAVTLGSPTAVNSLTMNSFSGTYTLGAAGQMMILNNGIMVNSGAGATTIVSPLTLGAGQSWLNNSTNLLTLAAVDNGSYLLTVGGSGNTTVSGSLSDTGGLTKNGNGTLTLATANTYSGNTTINAGTLVANGLGAVAGTTDFTVLTNATLVLSGSTGNTAWGPATVTGAGTVAVHGVVYNLGLNYDLSTFTGTLDLINGQFSVTPYYSPQFRSPTNGTIKIEDHTTVYLGWGNFVLDGTVQLCGYTDDGENLGLLRGDGTSVLNGSLILKTNSTIGAAGASDKFTINAVISDGGLTNGFTKVAGGTVILTANNTYSGPTIVYAGTLQCNNSGALGNDGAVTITNTGVLNLSYPGTHFVSALDLGGGNPQPPGTYGSSSSTAPAANQNDTYFAGTGTVTIPGPAQITAFAVPGALSVAIDPVALTIAVTMQPRTPVTSLAPTYTLSSGTCVPASGSTHNFTSPVTYTVTDGATVHVYTVTVTVPPTFYWAGPSGGNWSTPANWNNAVPGAADVAVFSDSASAGATVNLDADLAVAGLSFNNLVTNQTIASTGGHTLMLSSNSLSVNVEVQAGTLSISCPIDATPNGLNKGGAGVLNISGSLQTAGNITVGGMVLNNNASWTTINGGAIMDVNGVLTINDNATVDWSPENIAGVGINGGEVGTVVQNGGVFKGVPPTSWTQAWGPGLNLGGFGPGSTATYDLNGGVLVVGSIYDYNGTTLANGDWTLLPPDPSSPAIFRFNGGIVRATQSDSTDQYIQIEGGTNLMGNLTHAYVGLGGAKIDVATFNCGINQALEHDPLLGGTKDGGLHAMSTGGSGTLALYKVGTFNGPVTIDTTVKLNLGYVGNQNVTALSLGGAPQPVGTYGSSSSPAANKNDTYFAGTGTLTVAGLIAGFVAAPASGTLPLQVVFTDISTPGGSITNWSWDFGNGVTTNYTSYTPSLTNTYNAGWGTYPVTLIVRDTAGLTATNVLDIAVTQPAHLVVSSQAQLQSVTANVGPQTLVFAPGVGTFDLGGLTGAGSLWLADSSGGCVTLVVGGTGLDTEFDGVLTGCGGLTKVGGGTFTLAAANNTYHGDTVVSNGTLNVRGAIPGLWEGLVANGNNPWDTTDPIPHDSAQLSDRWAQSTQSGGNNVYPAWGDNTTWGYTGYFNNPASTNVEFTFGKNFDDNGLIAIDSGVLIDDTTAADFAATNYTLSPGWHTLELRLGQGGSGVGPQGQMTDVNSSASIGLGWSTDGGSTWHVFSDPGDGSELKAFSGNNVLPTNTTLRIVSPGVVNLGGSNLVEYLYIEGVSKVAGTWGSATSGAANKNNHFTGNGVLVVSQTGSSAPTPVTLTITSDGAGNWKIGGTTSPAMAGQTLHLYISHILSLGMAGFTDTGATATVGSNGTFSFLPSRNPATDGTPSFYLVK